MKNVESCMDWLSFSDKMKQSACRLSSSACPMVLVLPNGIEIRFTDINVDMFDYKGKRGDTEYTSIGFKVNLLGAEVIDVQDDGSLANSPYVNCAKMREALKAVRMFLDGYTVNNLELRRIVDAALAAPPRNCNVGNAAEQSVRMAEFCREQYKKTNGVALCSGCQFHNIEGVDCQFAWAQMPYEEGETNEKV